MLVREEVTEDLPIIMSHSGVIIRGNGPDDAAEGRGFRRMSVGRAGKILYCCVTTRKYRQNHLYWSPFFPISESLETTRDYVAETRRHDHLFSRYGSGK